MTNEQLVELLQMGIDTAGAGHNKGLFLAWGNAGTHSKAEECHDRESAAAVSKGRAETIKGESWKDIDRVCENRGYAVSWRLFILYESWEHCRI